MSSAGFEPAIPSAKRPQTYTLDLAATGIGPNIISVKKSKRMTETGHVTHMGDMRGACEILVGKSERKRTNIWRHTISQEGINIRLIGF
jgi:hypothetical protein